jgi:hypothetical protein
MNIDDNIRLHSGIMMSTEINTGVIFEDNRCPICAGDLSVYYTVGVPVVFMCNKCMYCTPIVRDHVNGKMRPDIHGDTSKFLSNFGSTNKFIGLTRMAIDRSMGDRYIWDL